MTLNAIYEWNIENYSPYFHCNHNDDVLISPMFSFGFLNDVKWFLSIELKYTHDGNYISCFLNRDKEAGTTNVIPLRFKLEVVIPPLTKFSQYDFQTSYFLEGARDGMNKCVKLMEMLRELKNMGKKNLFIFCKVIDFPVPSYRAYQDFASMKCQESDITTATTSISTNRQTFVWVVIYKNPKFWNAEKTFKFTDLSPMKIYIEFKIARLKIRITRLKEWHLSTHLCSCSFQLLDINKQLHYEINFTCRFPMKQRDEYETCVPVEISNLLNSAHKLILVCDFSISNGIIKNKSDVVEYTNPHSDSKYSIQRISPLYKDLKNTNISKSNCDLKFQVGLEEFPVHKSLLEIRCPGNHFKDGIIVISDVDESAFSVLLNYLYTRTINYITLHNCLNLLLAANKYKLHHLEKTCVLYINHNLSQINTNNALLIAYRIGNNLLKQKVLKFLERQK